MKEKWNIMNQPGAEGVGESRVFGRDNGVRVEFSSIVEEVQMNLQHVISNLDGLRERLRTQVSSLGSSTIPRKSETEYF